MADRPHGHGKGEGTGVGNVVEYKVTYIKFQKKFFPSCSTYAIPQAWIINTELEKKFFFFFQAVNRIPSRKE